MDEKPEEKRKQGMSVQEIENFGRKFRLELFYSVLFVLAAFFGCLMYAPGWSVVLAGIGGIVGIWIPSHVDMIASGTYSFLKKQNAAVNWIVVAISYIIAIFLPMIIFFIAGLGAAHALYFSAMKHDETPPPTDSPAE